MRYYDPVSRIVLSPLLRGLTVLAIQLASRPHNPRIHGLLLAAARVREGRVKRREEELLFNYHLFEYYIIPRENS